MKRAPLSTILLGSTFIALAMAYPTELAAGNGSHRGGSFSAGGVGVGAGWGGGSVSAGDVSVSAGRGGASVTAGGVGVSAGRGAGSVSVGEVDVSTGRSSVDASGLVSAPNGDRSLRGDARARAGQTGKLGHRSGDRSYGSIGEWFRDLRSLWSGQKSKGSDTRHQINRVVQTKSVTAIAPKGGSAVAESSNVNVTRQTD